MAAPAAVLPIFPQGTEPIAWIPGYRTDVIAGPGRPEQRIRLRERPVRTIEYQILTTTPEETQVARGVAYRFQGELIGIPLWLWASRLTAPSSIGATAFTLGTIADLVPWEAGSWVMLWRGNDGPAPVWELLEFASEASGVVHTVGGAAKAWAAGSILVPVQLARLGGRLEERNRTKDAFGAAISAELASTAGGALSRPAPPTYGSVEVLERIPRAAELGSDALDRPLEGFDPVTGDKDVRQASPAPTEGRSFPWLCQSRAELVELLAFLEDRAGRLKPFWIPSWRQDLTLAVAALAGAGSIRVTRTGFGEHVFPAGRYRRNLAFRSPSGVMQYRRATNVIDQGDGTELVLLDSVLSTGLPLGSLCMYLELVRLDTDEPRVLVQHAALMRAELPLAELPIEVPVVDGGSAVAPTFVSSGVQIEASADTAEITGISYEAGDTVLVWGVGDVSSQDFHVFAFGNELTAEAEVGQTSQSYLFLATYRPTAAGTGSVQFVSGTTDPKIGVGYVLLRGCEPANPIDRKVRASGSSASPDSGFALPTSQDGEMLVGAVLTEGPASDTAGTWADSFTAGARAGATPATLSLGYKGVTVAGSYRAAKTGITSRPWCAYLATVKAIG